MRNALHGKLSPMPAATSSAEFARLLPCPPAQVEVFHARFVRHRFAAHVHDEWAIGAVLQGVKDTAVRGERDNVVSAGRIHAIAPGDAHAGRSLDGQACEYVMLYVTDAEWRLRCAAHGIAPNALAQPIASQAQVAAFATLAARLEGTAADSDPACQIEWSLFWEGLCAALRQDEARAVPAIASATRDRPLARVRDHLHAVLHRNVTLAELAHEAALSEAELCRRFSAAYGLSPHRYQLVQRLLQCRRLLLDAVPIADVAAATGFADQSHMGRHFRAMFGMTPGALARQAGTRTF